ncbi:MAG: tRNA guanosine(34) transglycosylase Tgt [Actinobacteria bacterium]|nr:tRNA guanosine(34) transglycosylase Tgt [Actinomycetota bacterium]
MVNSNSDKGFSFEIIHAAESGLARVGTISTPHGQIQTPAFIPVGTKATVKTVLPEAMEDLGAQALLSNAYHLYLQPGPDVLDEAGGLGSFMNWDKPTFTDSGGFQVLSLGVGFKKVLAMDAQTFRSDQVIAKNKERLAHVDDEGVTFKSHLDGSMHRFTAEISMQIQHKLGADIMFAFDECTTLHNTRPYQELAMSRTYDWAIRCLDEHKKLTDQRATKPYQALFGVIQGAQYEDLRKKAASDLGGMSSSGIEFDGFGIGGALDKDSLGTIVGWVNSTLPQEKPKHLLGIGAPEDLFVGVENGVDTFDCVLASRIARTSAVYTMEGRFNVSNQPYIRDFNPIDDECDCYTCTHYTRAYLCHLFRGKEMVAGTLATIHNERFIVRLVDQMRQALIDGNFSDMKKDFMGRYKHKSGQSRD